VRRQHLGPTGQESGCGPEVLHPMEHLRGRGAPDD
jgi:hypothetical protein